MTKALLPPEYAREVGRLKNRVLALEKRLGELERGARDHGLPFVIDGAVFAKESPPWTPRFLTRAVDVIVLLGTAGTSTTSIELRKNGAAVGAGFALGSGEKMKRFSLSSPFTPDVDLLTVAVTAAGTGAEDLDVIVRFR